VPTALLGWGATWFVGLALGLIGGGGSILTVPILVYLFGVPATQATGDSLFIVGATSLAGALVHGVNGRVSTRVAAVFAPPSIAAVYVVRRWGVPLLPADIALWPGTSVRRDVLLMLGFAIVMAVAASAMIRRRSSVAPAATPHPVPLMLLAATVGAVAGFFGAGGGFLIVPALVLVAGLPMSTAVGTSLAIIAVQSLAGFVGVLQASPPADWPLLVGVTVLALTGMGAGLWLCPRISGPQLRAGFGWFVMAMSVVIAWHELSTWLA
jgi:uncharacterized membrane protein YfcA